MRTPHRLAALCAALLLSGVSPAFAAFNATANLSEVASTPTPSTTLQNAATANGNGTSLTTTGYAWVLLTVNCASCSGGTTVNFEGTQDGTNYTGLNAVQLTTSTVTSATTAAGITVWNAEVAGFQNIRARVSGYSAGTVTVTVTALPNAPPTRIVKLDPSNLNATFGGAFPAAGSAIGVENGTSLLALKGDSNGYAGVDLYAVGGAALALGQATMAASLPVAIASNQSALPASQSGTWTVQPGNTANTTAWLVTGTGGTFPAAESGTWTVGLNAGANTIGGVTLPDIEAGLGAGTAPAKMIVQGGVYNSAPPSLASGQTAAAQFDSSGRQLVDLGTALPAGGNTIGAVNQAGSWTVTANAGSGTFTVAQPMGCAGQAVSATNATSINLTASGQIIAGAASKQTYICAINLVAPNNAVALVEGIGTVCATGMAGMAGGTTAATGWVFNNATAPGVGLTEGNGRGVIAKTATAADNVCLLVGAATQVSGTIVWTQF